VKHGLLDTNIIIYFEKLNPTELPDISSISAITLAELTSGVHSAKDPTGRADRMNILQRVEKQFDPLPFDENAAREYGRIYAAVESIGRKPRKRIADQMIAAVAAANNLPLYTTNVEDYKGLEKLVKVVRVKRPPQ